MKTEKSKTKEVTVFKDMNSNPTTKQGKKLAVGIKTEAFGDKENLVQKCRLGFKDRKKITAEDLVSEAGPSQIHWETLAEQRRKALEEALNENSILHEKIELLQKENETLKQALADATEVIEVLNEIVAEDKSVKEGDSNDEENKTDNSKSPAKSYDNAFGDDSTILNDTIDGDKS